MYCSKCGKEIIFGNKKRSHYITKGKCRSCYMKQYRNSEYLKAYWAKNKERLKPVLREFHAKQMRNPTTREKIKTSKRLWWIKNKEKESKRRFIWRKQYYLKNKEKLNRMNNSNYKKYLKTPNGKLCMYKKNLKRNLILNKSYCSGHHTVKEWLDLLEKSQGCCAICGKFVGKDKLVKDHIIPLTFPEGSSDKIDNIQPACNKCNSGKGGYKWNAILYNFHALPKVGGIKIEV